MNPPKSSALEHEPTEIVSSDGQRFWDSEMEQEANWLGAALLVPREGALQITRTGRAIEEIAAHYGVSESLCRWRITQTGILRQIERGQAMDYLKQRSSAVLPKNPVAE